MQSQSTERSMVSISSLAYPLLTSKHLESSSRLASPALYSSTPFHHSDPRIMLRLHWMGVYIKKKKNWRALAMGNCCKSGSAKCANASTPFDSKVTISRSTTSNNNGPTGLQSTTAKLPAQQAGGSDSDDVFAGGGELKSFSMSDLRAATKNFGSNSYLGEGGFGMVFKGWIDEATLAPTKPGVGRMVAIKKLKKESSQGHREWLAEVTYLGQLHHRNLVSLVGFCSDSGSNKLLVYEYMLRGSLENHLFRRGTQPPLSWPTRVSIAVDVARGMSFLHSRDVIFRDLKSSNVLLDAGYRAKLSDFGLARDGPTGGKSHVSTRVVGTRGYAAPEYIATGHLSVKSDVYSFGVVLLELLTGRRAVDEEARGSLVDWARPHLALGERRRMARIMDTRLGGQYPKKQAQEVAALALRCLQNDPKSRPGMADGVLPELERLQQHNQHRTSYTSSTPPPEHTAEQAATTAPSPRGS
ncbi:hypothetical protein BS78_02G396200 [Paspalum vaginatum]|nr:hypothetical protein BS78_02G396200 [Paspalum vaginatum]